MVGCVVFRRRRDGESDTTSVLRDEVPPSVLEGFRFAPRSGTIHIEVLGRAAGGTYNTPLQRRLWRDAAELHRQAAKVGTVVNTETCIWCKGTFPATQGPTHEYMESSPGCWAAFGRVLAREYSHRQFFEIHRLTVDSYAVQHPGQPSRQSIQSVGVHLVRLCLFLEHGLTPEKANSAMLVAAKHKSEYFWLDPPASLGEITVANVDLAANAEQHKDLVRAWAAQMWQVWAPHHEIVRKWAIAA